MFDSLKINKRTRVCNFKFDESGKFFEYSEKNKKLFQAIEKDNIKTILAIHIPPEIDDKKIVDMMEKQGIQVEGWRHMSKGAVVAIRPEDYSKYVKIEKTVAGKVNPSFRIGYDGCSTNESLLGRDLTNLLRYKLENEFEEDKLARQIITL